MKKAKYIILDCETGGLSPQENPITQIALLTIDNTLKEVERFETFIKPYDDLKITKGALDATGLSMADINSGISNKQAVKVLIDYFKKAKGGSHASLKPVVVGHNVQFDTGFLEYLFQSANDDFWKYVNPTTVDTMVLTKMFNPTISSLKLGICCEEVGIDLPDAHKAMNDVIATTDLFRVYINKLRDAGDVTVSNSNNDKPKSRVKFQF